MWSLPRKKFDAQTMCLCSSVFRNLQLTMYFNDICCRSGITKLWQHIENGLMYQPLFQYLFFWYDGCIKDTTHRSLYSSGEDLGWLYGTSANQHSICHTARKYTLHQRILSLVVTGTAYKRWINIKLLGLTLFCCLKRLWIDQPSNLHLQYCAVVCRWFKTAKRICFPDRAVFGFKNLMGMSECYANEEILTTTLETCSNSSSYKY